MDLIPGNRTSEHIPISAVAMPKGTSSSAALRLRDLGLLRVSTVLMA